MADDGQRALADFDESEVDGRDAAEAAAVAGTQHASATVVEDDHRFPQVEETVDVAVTQVDYTIEGYGDDETVIIHVFGRTEDREPVHVRVHEFQPYFYAPVDSVTAVLPEDFEG